MLTSEMSLLLRKLVPQGFFDVINDQSFNRSSRGYEFQSELLLKRRKDRGPGHIRRIGRGGTVWRVLKIHDVLTRESSLVDNGVLQKLGQRVDERCNRNSLARELTETRHLQPRRRD
jgi:hypothetical protein